MAPPAWWDLPVQITILAVLIALSAFFSGSEVALIGLDSHRRRHLARNGNQQAGLVERLMRKPQRVLITILIGNNIVNITASVLAAVVATELMGGSAVGGAGLAIGGMTLLILTLGEILPKALAAGKPVAFGQAVARPIWLMQKVLYPIVLAFEGMTLLMYRVFGVPVERRIMADQAEFRTVVQVSTEEGVIEEDEKQMIHHVIDFAETTVHEVMIPRTDMVALSVDTSLDEATRTVVTKGRSRIPVYRESRDDIVGVLYAKDILAVMARTAQESPPDAPPTIEPLLKEPYFVPESSYINEVFADLRDRRVHLAIVLDEFGGTAGLVTMEDILEEIVGDIFDEYDTRVKELIRIDADQALIDARIPLEELNEALSIEVPEDEEFDTLGGWLFHELGRPGRTGEVVVALGYEWTLERVTGRRILWVRARRVDEEGDGDDSGSAT